MLYLDRWSFKVRKVNRKHSYLVSRKLVRFRQSRCITAVSLDLGHFFVYCTIEKKLLHSIAGRSYSQVILDSFVTADIFFFCFRLSSIISLVLRGKKKKSYSLELVTWFASILFFCEFLKLLDFSLPESFKSNFSLMPNHGRQNSLFPFFPLLYDNHIDINSKN